MSMPDRTPRLVVTMPDRHRNGLREMSDQTELSVSELLRRMVDHCFQPAVTNDMLPCMSGRITIGQ